MSDASTSSSTGMPITLAVFADTAELAGIEDHLRRLRRGSLALAAGGPQQAAYWCAEHGAPAVLLVDISAEPDPLAALLELAALAGPACRIVALGQRQDIDLYRQLLAAGIFDYLLKPLRLDQLADTLTRADHDLPLGQAGTARAGRTAAFVGTAGGLGTSTLVAALGQWLSSARKTPTVLVDFDRRKADLPLLLGLEAEDGLASLLDAPSIDPRLLQRTLRPVPPTASGTPETLYLLAQRPGRDTAIAAERALEIGSALGQLFSLSLWDLPAHRPSGSDEVLAHAEMRVVLTELSVQGARGAHRLLAEIGDESRGQSLLLIGSAAHQSAGAALEAAQFEDFVGRPLDLHLPHAGTALATSLLAGALAGHAAPLYADAVARLGLRLLGLPEQAHQAKGAGRGLARLLFGRRGKPSHAMARA